MLLLSGLGGAAYAFEGGPAQATLAAPGNAQSWGVAGKDDKGKENRGGGQKNEAKPNPPKASEQPQPAAKPEPKHEEPNKPSGQQPGGGHQSSSGGQSGGQSGGSSGSGGQSGGSGGGSNQGPQLTENPRGHSGSNPDGGGVDKPFPAAGQPAASQVWDSQKDTLDGNNGCGQDKHNPLEPREADFGQKHQGWDDNQGWCGKPHEKAVGNGQPGGPPETTPGTPGGQGGPRGGSPGSGQPGQGSGPSAGTTGGGAAPGGTTPGATSPGGAATGGTTPSSTSPGVATGAGAPSGGVSPAAGVLATLQPGTISPGQAAQVAARIGGGIAAEDVRGMGGAEIAQIARAAGVPVAEIESVLGQSASGAASGPAAEEVLGVQARRTYENVAAGAMPSTGGPPVAPLASVMTALGGLGLVLRRLSRGG